MVRRTEQHMLSAVLDIALAILLITPSEIEFSAHMLSLYYCLFEKDKIKKNEMTTREFVKVAALYTQNCIIILGDDVHKRGEK